MRRRQKGNNGFRLRFWYRQPLPHSNCKILTDLKKDPMFQMLDTTFQLVEMKEWLEEYFDRLSTWTSNQLMASMTATERAANAGSLFGKGFKIDVAARDNAKEENRLVLLWVLVYRLQEVVAKPLFNELSHHLSTVDPKFDEKTLGTTVTWKMVVDFIYSLAADGDATSDLIVYTVCLHREAGTYLSDWFRALIAAKARMTDASIKYPDSFWSNRAWICMTSYEKALMKQDQSPTKNLKLLSQNYSRSALRPYPESEARRTRPLIPILGGQPSAPRTDKPKSKDSRKDKTNRHQKGDKPKQTQTCDWCGLTGHTAALCRKKKDGMSREEAKAAAKRSAAWRDSQKKGDGSERKSPDRKCHICGSSKHLKKDCPKKVKSKADEGFAAEGKPKVEEMEQREESLGPDDDFWMMEGYPEEMWAGETDRPECLRASVTVHLPNQEQRNIVTSIDSFASRSFCRSDLAISYRDLPPKLRVRYSHLRDPAPLTIRTGGGLVDFKDHGFVCIQKLDKKLVIPVVVTTPKFLPSGCGVLLGIDSITEHKIDINKQVALGATGGRHDV